MEGELMKRSNNYVRIEGCVKEDAKSKRIREGLSAMDFTLVVNGVEKERATYVDCISYGDVVNGLDGYVDKGEYMELEGHLTFRTYTAPDGTKRTGMVVYVDEVLG
jgi:single-stranded DNA-binding protein